MASDNHPNTPVPVKVAARCLGVKPADIMAEIAGGEFPVVKVGETTLVHVPTAAEWLANKARSNAGIPLPVDSKRDEVDRTNTFELTARICVENDYVGGLEKRVFSETFFEPSVGKNLDACEDINLGVRIAHLIIWYGPKNRQVNLLKEVLETFDAEGQWDDDSFNELATWLKSPSSQTPS